jgi:zinc protease
MRYIPLLLSALIASSTSAKPLPITVHETHLENGLQVLSVERFDSSTVSVQLWVRTGSRDERPGITGIAHLFEHMMFKGSKNLGPEEHANRVSKIGGQLNAYTTNDMTVYYENVAAPHMETIFELEAERFQRLALSAKMLTSERQVVKEERRMRTDNSPVGKLLEAFYDLAYREHPYRWPVVGWMKDLDAIALADCQAFFEAHYNPANITVIVVGAAKHQRVFAGVTQYFGDWKAVKRPARSYPAEPEPKGPGRKTITFATKTPLLLGGWPVPAARHPDVVALRVLGRILSGGESSRMHRTLVYKKEQAMYAAGDVLRHADSGQFYLWAAARPGVGLDAVEAGMVALVAEVQAHGVTDAELQAARKQMTRATVYGLKKAHGIAGLLGRSIIYHGDWRPALDELDRLRAVSAADVQRVAKKYLRPERIRVVQLVPEPEAKQ